MKLRIYKNSLRVRLDDEDLEQLIGSSCITERLQFSADEEECLIYSVETLDSETRASVEFRTGHIRVFIGQETARKLADGSQVAVEATQLADGASPLEILVEKELLP